jgi:general secretion pathway protein K
MAGEVGASRASERGVALIAVLWGVALLAVIAGSFADAARTETVIARNLVERARATALAEAGIYRAVLGLLDPVAERRWRGDGQTYRFVLGGGEVRVSIQDEGGKIDLNAAPDALLVGLFRAAGRTEESAALADAVADWRDEDDLRRVNGAEENEYRTADLGHGPKNQAFEAIEELQQVLGVSLPLYEQVAPAVTVYSRRRSVNTATAPAQVLRSLPGMNEAKVRALLQEREQSLTAATEGRSSARAGASPRSRIGVYTIHAEARTAGGATFGREAVARITGESDQPFLFLAWRHGDSTLFESAASD